MAASRRPDRHLEIERDRERLLRVGTSRHERVAVTLGEG